MDQPIINTDSSLSSHSSTTESEGTDMILPEDVEKMSEDLLKMSTEDGTQKPQDLPPLLNAPPQQQQDMPWLNKTNTEAPMYQTIVQPFKPADDNMKFNPWKKSENTMYQPPPPPPQYKPVVHTNRHTDILMSLLQSAQEKLDVINHENTKLKIKLYSQKKQEQKKKSKKEKSKK